MTSSPGSVLDNAAYPTNPLERIVALEQRIRVLEENLGVAGGAEIDIDTTPLTFDDGDTTPSVAEADHNQLYICGNSGATSITDFDDGTEGQFIEVLFTTGNTTLVDGSGLQLNNSTNYSPPTDTIMGFRRYSGSWYERSRRNP